MINIMHLPNEILKHIVKNLEVIDDIKNIRLTCKNLSELVPHYIETIESSEGTFLDAKFLLKFDNLVRIKNNVIVIVNNRLDFYLLSKLQKLKSINIIYKNIHYNKVKPLSHKITRMVASWLSFKKDISSCDYKFTFYRPHILRYGNKDIMRNQRIRIKDLNNKKEFSLKVFSAASMNYDNIISVIKNFGELVECTDFIYVKQTHLLKKIRTLFLTNNNLFFPELMRQINVDNINIKYVADWLLVSHCISLKNFIYNEPIKIKGKTIHINEFVMLLRIYPLITSVMINVDNYHDLKYLLDTANNYPKTKFYIYVAGKYKLTYKNHTVISL